MLNFKLIFSCKSLPGSPKRRPFQRQRAASETTDHTEDDSSPLRDEVIESVPHTPIQTSGLQSLSAEFLSHPATSVFLSRYIPSHNPMTCTMKFSELLIN